HIRTALFEHHRSDTSGSEIQCQRETHGACPRNDDLSGVWCSHARIVAIEVATHAQQGSFEIDAMPSPPPVRTIAANTMSQWLQAPPPSIRPLFGSSNPTRSGRRRAAAFCSKSKVCVYAGFSRASR